MARATPDLKITTMLQAIIKKGMDTGDCSMLGAKLEGAVEAKVAELGLTVVGASVVVMVEEMVLEVGAPYSYITTGPRSRVLPLPVSSTT